MRSLVAGIILLLMFFAPLYYLPASCCGHPYWEGITFVKLIIGRESCLVFSTTENLIALLYPIAFFVSMGLMFVGLGEVWEAKKRRKNETMC